MKKIVIVDIDGTIADASNLTKFFEKDPIDWDGYFANLHKCKPIKTIIDLVTDLYFSDHKIVFLTARGEECRETTEKWLSDNFIEAFKYDDLIMRKEGDRRDDDVVKLELFEKSGIDKKDVDFVLDDRDSVVKMWRDNGFVCLQPAYGDF